MMNSQKLQLPVQDLMSLRGRSFIISKVMMHQCTAAASSSSSPAPAARGLQVAAHPSPSRRRRPRGLVAAVGSDDDECASDGGESESSSSGGKDDGGGLSREDLERLVGSDEDAKFNGLDLANLIRKKYGRSYDVTLIKKVCMFVASFFLSSATSKYMHAGVHGEESAGHECDVEVQGASELAFHLSIDPSQCVASSCMMMNCRDRSR